MIKKKNTRHAELTQFYRTFFRFSARHPLLRKRARIKNLKGILNIIKVSLYNVLQVRYNKTILNYRKGVDYEVYNYSYRRNTKNNKKKQEGNCITLQKLGGKYFD
jgi:hypothetical protein